MELKELQKLVRTKLFRSTMCGRAFKFLSGEMLEVNGISAEPYSIIEHNNWFVLQPNECLGNQQLIMKVEDVRYPVTITLYKKSNLDFFTTFIEE